ncbi:Pre-mRNA-splicing factor of RES complex-domain-containing protein [Phycomyces nitens]|nr:Pre-mRNA-splicing factor of RES complex-domain-containing protein [Phycomyces nitens]
MDSIEHQDFAKRKFLAKGVGDAATKEYIANKYLSSGPDEKKKKKKRKIDSKKIRRGNIGIVDEEEFGWKNIGTQEEEAETKRYQEEQERLMAEAAASKEAAKSRASSWQTIRGEEKIDYEEENDNDSEMEDEKPMVVYQEEAGGPRMSNGQKTGLLTSHEHKAESARARESELKAMQRLKEDSQGQGAETIYRDATGRKVDPKIKKAEEARAKKEADERESRRMEWGKGLVQREEAQAELKRLKEEKDKPLARIYLLHFRYVDDEDYNQGLKDRDRWNDPAAGFLTKKSKGKTSVSRPSYKGPWKPNRFMIPPGYRWDGVDRSNGFEDTFLLHLNQKKSMAAEAHAWSTEDM